MKKLHFDYYMQIDYSVEVSKCNFTIKCIPGNNERQTVDNINIQLYPDTHYCQGVDGLNNIQIYGSNEKPHKTFSFRITGDAKVGMKEYDEIADDSVVMIFRHPYGLNVAGKSIKEYYAKIIPDREKDILTRTTEIMNRLHEDFKYRANSTDVNTTAEEAFALGCGVCQDYAHIFISLLHLAGIPARYVTGLIVGEGASHAWVEVLQDDKWYGFDPTNNVRVKDEHIKIGIGRDAHDCMINRGIMHGGGFHTQKINVNVKEM